MQPWQAQLTLCFAAREGKTALIHNSHTGPLRVQKALYPEPESPSICHAVMVHPPAGIAGGDLLRVDVAVQAHAHAVLSTPGATQWYKSSADKPASMSVALQLDEHARLDWLPQENILFDGSHAQLHTSLDLAPTASAIGWDVSMLGRTARGETWQQAALQQRSRITRAGKNVWLEHSDLCSDAALRGNAAALAGHCIMGTLWAVGEHASSDMAQAFAVGLPYRNDLKAGITCLNDEHTKGGALLLRVLGDEMQAVRACMVDAWLRLRPLIHGVQAVPLRLWAL
jgi:urease accessory protein